MASKGGSRSIYLLLHTPVHIHRPLQVGYVEKNKWSNELFEKYMQGVEDNRKGGCGRRYLSKRDIERWGFMPPCGARFEVVELDLTWLPQVQPTHLEGESVEDKDAPTIECIFKENSTPNGTKKPEMR